MPNDRQYLRLAESVATIFSKEGTKVGAVVLGDYPNQLAIGYNGLPPGIADDDRRLDRAWRLPRMRHAEANALSNVSGFMPQTIYSTHYPCLQCAMAILSSRTVRRVVTCQPMGQYAERWGAECEASKAAFAEAGVAVDLIDTRERGEFWS